MKNLRFIITFAVSLILCIPTVYANLELPAIISSNMVLQRNTTVSLWGWADAQEQIMIETSWLDVPIQTEADAQGKWSVKIETTDSKDPQSIHFNSSDSDIKLENILFGEVWLCSGQSNMEQPIKGFSAQPTYGSLMAIAKSSNPNLRLFSVKRKVSKTPLKDVEGYVAWDQASHKNVAAFSAVGYFFGKQLQEVLDVPVGLIYTTWGGSPVQAWIADEELKKHENYDLDEITLEESPQKVPTALYNGMIHPLIPYAVKGMLWYQGESNRHEPEAYKKLFPIMVRDWRSRWGIGDFPFFYAQISPFPYECMRDAFNTVDNTAFLREAQLQSLHVIPNSGMAVTMDLGDEIWIHPPQKKEVADRFLFLALNKTYGYENVDSDSPIYNSMEVQEGGIKLKFKHAENGLYAYDGKLEGFEIAGEDRVFYPAHAIILKRFEVLVKSEQVPHPVAVRYAWKNWIKGTLYDANLLPASSFRTDSWEDATQQ